MSNIFTPILEWLKGSITSVEYNYRAEKMIVYYKYEGVDMMQELETGKHYKPFIHISDGKSGKYNIIKHTNFYKNILTWKKSAGKNALSFPPETQFLVQSKSSYFKDLSLSDLMIMIIDLETTSLDPSQGEIIAMGIKFNKPMKNGEYRIILRQDEFGSEGKMLAEFLRIIKEEDPTIIANHNIFNFDIPYIEYRMNFNEIPLELGKYGKKMTKDYRTTKIHNLIKGQEFYQYRIPGRHIIDTMHLAQIEDTRRNSFENYTLKYLAKELDLAPDNRVYLTPAQIKDLYYKKDPDFDKYLYDDLDEAMGLLKMFLPSSFATSKFVPISLQNIVYAGATTKARALFLGEYYHAEKAIPVPQQKEDFEGAISKAQQKGIFDNVHKYDVSSLYPSIMMVFEYYPKSDELGVFEKYLKLFTSERLRYKKLLQKEEELIEAGTGDPVKKEEFDAFQLAFKIFINSFYGILGNEFFPWNDYKMAAAVTAKGRETLLKMIDVLTEENCKILSLDTDGVYFSSPTDKDPKEMLKKVNAAMVSGINVEFEKSFKSFLSYKGKTYAASYFDDKKPPLLKGSAFKGRGIPSFMRKFIKSSVHYILTNNLEAYRNQLFLLKRSIAQKSLKIEEVYEIKKISYPYNTYIRKEKGQKIGYFEAMEREGRTNEYRTGDRVCFYFSGDSYTSKTKKNEMVKLYIEDEEHTDIDYNPDYYIEKLNKWEEKLEPFIIQRGIELGSHEEDEGDEE